MEIIRRHEMIEEIFAPWALELGPAHEGYKGHVYRQFNFCRALVHAEEAKMYGAPEGIDERIAIAAAFHDVGVWLSRTMDYLGPSRLRMDMWLRARDRQAWAPELHAMIEYHHKLTPYRSEHAALAEPFRQADLVDLSFGLIRYGLPSAFVRDVRAAFPNRGFHISLVRALTAYSLRHPFRPMPMMRR